MKFLIVSHGTFAQGIFSASSIILGNMDDVEYINAYVNEINLKDQLDIYLKKNVGETILVLTDIFGGSVNQTLMSYVSNYPIWLVTGVNLPCVLEMLSKKEQLNEKTIENIVNEAKKQIQFVNNILRNIDPDDDFD